MDLALKKPTKVDMPCNPNNQPSLSLSHSHFLAKTFKYAHKSMLFTSIKRYFTMIFQ